MAAPVDETGLIQRYLAPLAAGGALGLKDDAACLFPTPDHELVITADAIVEGTHFLATDNPADIAAKAIAVNLSDLTAKGAAPLGYLLTIVFPETPDEAWMEAFASGLSARAHGRILGGDMTVGGSVLSVSVTALGEVPRGTMVRRNGASTGDILFVTGPIGTKAAGLLAATEPQWLATTGVDDKAAAALVSEYAAPPIPFADIYARTIRENASAALDISDGLLIDAERLCRASGTGARIEAERIPLDSNVRKLIENAHFSLEQVVTGGDDYVVLFAVPPRLAGRIEAAATIARCHRVGEIVSPAEGVQIIGRDGLAMDISGRRGYDHFSRRHGEA